MLSPAASSSHIYYRRGLDEEISLPNNRQSVLKMLIAAMRCEVLPLRQASYIRHRQDISIRKSRFLAMVNWAQNGNGRHVLQSGAPAAKKAFYPKEFDMIPPFATHCSVICWLRIEVWRQTITSIPKALFSSHIQLPLKSDSEYKWRQEPLSRCHNWIVSITLLRINIWSPAYD